MAARSKQGQVIAALIGATVCTVASAGATESGQWAYIADDTGSLVKRSAIIGTPSGILGDAGFRVHFTCEKPFERDGTSREHRLTFSVQIPSSTEAGEVSDALADINVYNEQGKFSTELERSPKDSKLVLFVRSFPAENYSDARDRRILDLAESSESVFALSVVIENEGFSMNFETAGLDEIAKKIQTDCRR